LADCGLRVIASNGTRAQRYGLAHLTLTVRNEHRRLIHAREVVFGQARARHEFRARTRLRDRDIVEGALSYLVRLYESRFLLVLHRRVALHQLLKPLVTIVLLLPPVTTVKLAARFLLSLGFGLAKASERIGGEVQTGRERLRLRGRRGAETCQLVSSCGGR
jgi:hypothetical protein